MDGAFTALLLVICVASSDAVQPPSNLTVSCQNLQTTVSWDYSDHQPHTIFWVTVSGSNFERPFNTTDHQYDLSEFVWSSEKYYLDFLCVTVTAVQDGSESEVVRSKSFSFSQLQSVDLKCELNFPPVDVRVAEMGSSVSFRNPLDFYKLRGTVEPGSAPELKYTVSLDGKSDFPGLCSEMDTNCKCDVKFSEDMEKCVTLKGELFFGSSHEVKFNKTEKFCSEENTADGTVVLAVVLGSIFLVVLIVAAVIIFKVKAWTMKIPSPSPHVMNMKRSPQQRCCSPSVDPDISPVSTFEQPSTHPKDDNCAGHLQGSDSGCDHSSYGYEGRACLGGSNLDLEAAGLMSGANGTDEDSADGSQSTECVSISSMEEERGAYDSRHFVHMDMGGGDMVNGYTGN
ncbi:interferon gamma receptor 1 [Fundulus diaphanus]